MIYGRFDRKIMTIKKSKNTPISPPFLNHTNFSWTIFFTELSWNPHFTYYANFLHLLLDLPNFVSLTITNSFIFNLVYTTRVNLIEWLNWNYKKLLKCVDISDVLHGNLDNKKIYEFPNIPTISPPYPRRIKLQYLIKWVSPTNPLCS